jgi:predicted protein tyrosine phosphatase
MDLIKIKVFPYFQFFYEMEELGLNDENVENTNMAFISITETQECLRYYLEEENIKHFFNDHQNVLNLDFDDACDNILYNGHLFKTMTMNQAEKAIDFIEEMVENHIDEIKIHCRAGVSRSRAFAEFIYRYCKEHNIDVEYDDRDKYTTLLNPSVLKKLNHAYWKKHGLNGYDEGIDYPEELSNPQTKIINTED